DEVLDANRAFYREAKASGRPSWRGIAAANLAQTLRARETVPEAAELAQEAVELFRGLDRTSTLSWALGNLGATLAELGHVQAAIAATLEAADIAERLQIPGMIADALRTGVPVALAAEKPSLAARLWGGVLQIRDRDHVEQQLMDVQLADRWLKAAEV